MEKPAICELSLRRNGSKKQESQLMLFLQTNNGYNNLENTEKLFSCLKNVENEKSVTESLLNLQHQEFTNVKVFRRLSYENISYKRGIISLMKHIECVAIEERKEGETDFSLKVRHFKLTRNPGDP